MKISDEMAMSSNKCHYESQEEELEEDAEEEDKVQE
jgi:hypothetical protein